MTLKPEVGRQMLHAVNCRFYDDCLATRIMKNQFLIIMITALLGVALPDDTAVAGEPAVSWKQVKDKEEIQVFTHKTPDSPLVVAKGVTIIDASLKTVAHILDDNSSHTQWVPYLLESRRLETISPTERLEYNLFKAPWPASGRDFVYRVTAVEDEDYGSVIFHMRSEASPLMPEQKNLIRGILLESTYKLTTLGPERIQVELMFHANPRGWNPVWIVNIIQRAWPYLLLKRLKEQATNGYSGER